jgi:flavin-dependent dehydrogenase
MIFPHNLTFGEASSILKLVDKIQIILTKGENMKIIVIGAGQGALVAARNLAAAGHSVDIYEKCSAENLSYDWHDDVEEAVFAEVGVPIPKESFKKSNWSFVAPGSDKCVKIEIPEKDLDLSVERRPLTKTLVSMALEAGARIHYSSEAQGLIIENGRVKGATVGGEKLYADLVIDGSGATSRLRASLPASFNIQTTPRAGELFIAWRAFFNSNEGFIPGADTDTNKVYLRHLGEGGISWCIYQPQSGHVNVLIGRIDKLSAETKDAALADLKKNNPVLGDKILRGGFNTIIPVRYPISRMVADGYALIGDSAFMTIPMLGSGIANCLRAGKILASVINKTNSSDADKLWNYQVKYFKAIGAAHAGVDVLKRWLLVADPKKIRFVFESGVISEDDLKHASVGETVKLGGVEMLKKLKAGFRHLFFLVKLALVLEKGKNATKVALQIPEKFDNEKILVWQKKLDSMYS